MPMVTIVQYTFVTMGAQVSKQSVGAHETTVHAGSGVVVKYFNINYYKDAASSGLTKQDFS